MFGGQEEIIKTQLFQIVHCTGTHKSNDSNYTQHVTSKQVHQSWQPFPVSVKVVVVRDSKAKNSMRVFVKQDNNDSSCSSRWVGCVGSTNQGLGCFGNRKKKLEKWPQV